MKKSFLVFLTMVLCISASAQAFEVKFIYFRPSDIWADATRAISTVAEGAWEFYADELERNGFDRKTFNVERDGDDIVVHIVDGVHGWQHYLTETWPKVFAELPNEFNQDTVPWDKQDDVICVIVGGVDSVSGFWGVGWPYHSGRYGGSAYIAINAPITPGLIAHELGHTFGLYHRPPGFEGEHLEEYEARWLDKHYHFNNRVNNFHKPSVEGTPRMTATKFDTLKFELIANSDIGLHQAKIMRVDDIVVIAYEYFNGENRKILTLEANRRQWRNDMYLLLMDVNGNYIMKKIHIRTLPTFGDDPNVINTHAKNPDLDLADDNGQEQSGADTQIDLSTLDCETIRILCQVCQNSGQSPPKTSPGLMRVSEIWARLKMRE